MSKRFQKYAVAFTLVEILVVVAILAILMAVLFPVLGSIQGKGRAAACMNNLKQIGVAFQLYAQDNQGRLPPNQTTIPGKETWIDWLYPYATGKEAKPGWSRVDKVFRCPEWVAMGKASGSAQGYAKNFRLASTPGAVGATATEYTLLEASAPQASKKILVVDHWDFNADLQRYSNLASYLDRGKTGPSRHGGKLNNPKAPGTANYLFMDGSVRPLSNTEEAIRPYLL